MLKIILIFIILESLLFSVSLKNINPDFTKADEKRVLKTLNIPGKFVDNIEYQEMKRDIDKLDVYYFKDTIKSGEVIIHTLKDIIHKSNVPDTFLYMAMIESKFMMHAKSNRKAVGLWQFIPSTAKKFNLTINKKIDERLDPIKSTKAAIKYLQYLKKRFKKWYLVAMAYNCGETRLAKAIRAANTNDISTLLSLDEKYIPKETNRYIKKLIIASLLANSKTITTQTHIRDKKSDKKLQELEVQRGLSLKNIAKKLNISAKTLKKYNPHLLKGVIPKDKKRYCIYVPSNELNDSSKKVCSNYNIFSYTVKEGDTLFKISLRHNNKMSAIHQLNKNLSSVLSIGQKIILIGDNKTNSKIGKKRVNFKIKESNQSIKIKDTNETNVTINAKETNQTIDKKESNSTNITIPVKETNQSVKSKEIINKKELKFSPYLKQKSDILGKEKDNFKTLKILNYED